jgi:hypothetical protein
MLSCDSLFDSFNEKFRRIEPHHPMSALEVGQSRELPDIGEVLIGAALVDPLALSDVPHLDMLVLGLLEVEPPLVKAFYKVPSLKVRGLELLFERLQFINYRDFLSLQVDFEKVPFSVAGDKGGAADMRVVFHARENVILLFVILALGQVFGVPRYFRKNMKDLPIVDVNELITL